MRTPEQIEELKWQRAHVLQAGGPIRIHYLRGYSEPWFIAIKKPHYGTFEYAHFATFGQCCAAIRTLHAPVEAYTANVWGHPWYDGTGKSIYGGTRDGVA